MMTSSVEGGTDTDADDSYINEEEEYAGKISSLDVLRALRMHHMHDLNGGDGLQEWVEDGGGVEDGDVSATNSSTSSSSSSSDESDSDGMLQQEYCGRRGVAKVENLSDLLSLNNAAGADGGSKQELPLGLYEVLLKPRFLHQPVATAIDGKVDSDKKSRSEQSSSHQRRSLFPNSVYKASPTSTRDSSVLSTNDKSSEKENGLGNEIISRDREDDEGDDENDYITEADGAIEDLSLGMKLTM